MLIRKFYCLLATMALTVPAFGDILEFGEKSSELNGVPIYTSGLYSSGDQDLLLADLGHGLRKKKVGFIGVNVYVAQIMGAEAAAFIKDPKQALDSLGQMKAFAIRMEFLRDVSEQKVKKAYEDSLELNQVDMGSDSVKGFLEAVEKGGPGVSGEQFIILGLMEADKETIIYQGTNGKVFQVTGGSDWVKSVFSIWLGETTDKGLKTLKNNLLGGQ